MFNILKNISRKMKYEIILTVSYVVALGFLIIVFRVKCMLFTCHDENEYTN